MGLLKKILLTWISVVLTGCIFYLLVPNGGTDGWFLHALYMLLGIVCFFIYLKEPIPANRPIFLNFAVFFLLSAAGFVSNFVGYAIVPESPFARFYWVEYHSLLYFFLLPFAIVYVVADSLFNHFKLYKKYSIVLLIVGGTFLYYNSPALENARYMYGTEDIIDYKAIDQSIGILESVGKVSPSSNELAAVTSLKVQRDGREVGLLFADQKVRRVVELLPYFQTENGYIPLLWKPQFLNNIYMSTLCIVFIFLFFGYQYKNDPPQGAYIEKIIFLFLPYCSLEILHHYAYINSVEYATLVDVQQIGYYLTLLNLLLLLVFFGLRLRFITSVKGEFYERELVSDSEHISRWRDAFDNLVVRHFLNSKAIHGRLFAPRTPRNKA